jgi:uncharacterized protein (TIGR02679 family)
MSRPGAAASEAAGLAAEPGLSRLLDGAATRYRSLGRVGGSVRLHSLSAVEARALHHLRATGRALPHAGGEARVELARLDRALADAGGLLQVMRAAGHDLTTDEQRRCSQAAAYARAWDRALDAAQDPATVNWVLALRAHRASAPPRALPAVLAAVALLERDGTAWDRARLASEVCDDPHALDDGKPATALLLAALAHREQRPPPGDASARRALLARHGILTDPHSSTVLVVGLRATGSGPAARQLAAADGAHAVLTLSQLVASSLRSVKGVGLRTCEGPVVIRAAEASFGEEIRSPLICTDGQPSAACDALLRQLARPVLHSGDFEWGGLRIAGVMSRRYRARPWRHGVGDYERALQRLPARAPALEAPRGSAPQGFESVWQRLVARRVPVWQEDLLELLVEDMAVAR